jgi:hypothetical protein
MARCSRGCFAQFLRLGPHSLQQFYEWQSYRVPMSTITLSVRSVGLALLILAAIGHADLNAGLPSSGPRFSGLGRLGRDLVRRTNGEEIAAVFTLGRVFS